jgi:hypothetical protein
MGKPSTRHFARYRTEIPIVVKVLGQDGYLRVHGRCFEIAESGLGAVISSELTVGEMATLEFELPEHEEPFVIRAIIRHRMGFLHGFEFLGLLAGQVEQIRQFCHLLTPM